MKSLSNLNLKNKKYIIFDMDGTLIDSIGVWNMTDQYLIEKYGHVLIDLDTIQKDRDNFLHDNQSGDTYLKYSQYLMQKYHFNIDILTLTQARRNMASNILGSKTDFKKGAVDLILKLKSLGFTLILASMTTKRQVAIYSQKNMKMRKQMDIAKVFDLILTIEDVQNKKPHPEIFNKALDHYNAKKEECLIFEDSYTGVLASYNAGIEVVNVYDKYADDLRDKINELTDYSIKDFNEFTKLVEACYN